MARAGKLPFLWELTMTLKTSTGRLLPLTLAGFTAPPIWGLPPPPAVDLVPGQPYSFQRNRNSVLVLQIICFVGLFFFFNFMILVMFDLSIHQKRKLNGDARWGQMMWGSCRRQGNGQLYQTTTTSPCTFLSLLLAAPREHAEDLLTSPMGIYT